MRNTPLHRPAAPNDQPEFLTIPEVANRLRQSVSTVRRRIASGELKSVKDARVLVATRDFYDYVERRRRRSKRRPSLGCLVHLPAEDSQVIDPSITINMV